MNTNSRIFIGLSDIAGYYQSLSVGLSKRGYKITFFNSNITKFNPDYYPIDNHLIIVRVLLFAHKQFYKRSSFFNRFFWIFVIDFFNFLFFIWTVFNIDIFIFGFGRTFIRGAVDIWVLNKLGKKVISNIGHGSESRPPYIDGYSFNNEGEHIALYKVLFKSLIKKNKIKRIEKYSDIIINTPYTCHFNKKKFINWYAIGMPIIWKDFKIIHKSENTIRILHAPSHPFFKGTIYIRNSINQLKNEGYKINYIEIINMSHKRVMDELALCDFVVDQVLGLGHLSGFGVEAALFGKPTIIGGFNSINNREFIPEDMYPPTHFCHLNNLKDEIAYMINNKHYRVNLGIKAKNFVNDKYSVDVVVNNYIKLINNKINNEWYLDPNSIKNVYAVGAPNDKLKELVKKMIDKYGIKSLQLSHRPDLEKAFIDFANSTDD